ncbi:alpha/beta hydrolase [Leuconostoc palmae]|uniref:alpha/beta hydrolase n=1 Tax=Leuconostoc palmae TaxID=501487 RepID=UPI001C7D6945|nr:alpha/beta hydrolase [Leuconostoc palmae]
MLFKDKPYKFKPASLPKNLAKIYRDVQYAEGSRHRLDIYLPKSDHACPVIIDIYGGGLLRGNKSSFKLNPSLNFIEDGFAVVSMDYSLNSPTINNFPNQIGEIHIALNFLMTHQRDYSIDMSHITLIGESSGAQLAVLAAASFSASVLLGDSYYFEKSNSSSFHIESVIALYGPYQVDQFATQFEQLDIVPEFSETGTAYSFEGIMLNNQPPKDRPDLVKQANPAYYFTRDMPPLMLIAGKMDPVVPYLQSINLADSYRHSVGNTIETILVENGVHGPTDYNNNAIHEKKLTFINRYKKST